MKPVILLVAILIAISSCNKGGSGTPPAPPAKDTSYLRKTEIVYRYDLSGNKLPDSSITKWAYDSKGRVVFECDKAYNGSNTDTFNTSYGSGLITTDVVYYSNGVLQGKTHQENYLNSQGWSDSTVFNSTSFVVNNGNPVVFNNSNIIVSAYFPDSNGNDTLDMYYSYVNNIKTVSSITRKIYLNNVLDSSVSYLPGWVKTQSFQWNAGSLMNETDYNPDGSVKATDNYTYTNILSGGFYGYTGGKYLQATTSDTGIYAPGGSISETYTYTFDSANRVSSMLQKFSGTYGNIQSVYMYY
jgi:hypothetical protein